MTHLPPIRIERKGFRRWWAPSRDELRRSCAFAASEARKVIWKSPEALCRYLVWSVGEQLGRVVECVIEGTHDDDSPVISMHMGEFSHFIAVRDTTIEDPPNDLTDHVRGFIARSLGKEPAGDVAEAVAAIAGKAHETLKAKKA